MHSGEAITNLPIQPHTQDGEPSYKRSHLKYQTYLFYALEALVFVAIVVPLSVNAGVFTTLASFLQTAPPAVVYEESINSVHETGVLTAALHSDPQSATGGGEVIAEEGSLVSHGLAGADDFQKSPSTGEISVYTVREGDTPSQIAEMFGVSVNTIYWANDITNGVIQPGKTLVILPITGIRHVVKEGDTIASIAKKYSGDIEEILAYNQFTEESAIATGDTVVVPHGEAQTAPKSTVASAKPTSVSGAVSVSSGFTHPVPGARRTQGIHGYNAVDLAAPIGTPIRAAAAGEVIVSKGSGWNGGYGRYIVIKHNDGTQTLYAHNSSNAVGVGAYVAQGETIGYVGNSGRSTGAHTHFEVRGASNPF